ncbi:MAG: GDP-mannose 4,6-dehydratase [Thermaerobacter sp.]|nr:GDP-mannose 4,6-dehydratase [Thermaerobacter sp.]
MSRKVALVTGAAGFLGSHLCDRLLTDGFVVIGIDNLSTGNMHNLAEALRNSNFVFRETDLVRAGPKRLAKDVEEVTGSDKSLSLVFHLASPASPVHYQRLGIETMLVNGLGTHYLAELAVRTGARFVLASTSEVYGDPEISPQPETYWGRVNPNGPRSCYDESKRFAEALTLEYVKRYGLEAVLVRIFNTYGPRMAKDDGRMIPNFIQQCLEGVPMTIYGNGQQTRSLIFVEDEVEGIIRLGKLPEVPQGPVNVGSDEEHQVLEIANLVAKVVGVKPNYRFVTLPTDDPKRRRPNLGKIRSLIDWGPTIPLEEGVKRTIAWLKHS